MCNDIQIYVADLAAYNNGKLHGVWIDATDELSDIQAQVQVMLANSPETDAEEYAIHDYEGFGNYALSEYEGLESAHSVACFIDAYPEYGAELLNYFCDIEEARKVADEQYLGCFDNLADYAQELTEDTCDVPQHLQYFIDYDKMARDMEMSGDVFTIEDDQHNIHVFTNC